MNTSRRGFLGLLAGALGAAATGKLPALPDSEETLYGPMPPAVLTADMLLPFTEEAAEDFPTPLLHQVYRARLLRMREEVDRQIFG